MNAYFNMVNSSQAKGIYVPKLRLTSERDDQVGMNRQEVQALLSEDNVFAVSPVAVLLFTGADLLAREGVQTFGWNMNAEWVPSRGRARRTRSEREGLVLFHVPVPARAVARQAGESQEGRRAVLSGSAVGGLHRGPPSRVREVSVGEDRVLRYQPHPGERIFRGLLRVDVLHTLRGEAETQGSKGLPEVDEEGRLRADDGLKAAGPEFIPPEDRRRDQQDDRLHGGRAPSRHRLDYRAQAKSAAGVRCPFGGPPGGPIPPATSCRKRQVRTLWCSRFRSPSFWRCS